MAGRPGSISNTTTTTTTFTTTPHRSTHDNIRTVTSMVTTGSPKVHQRSTKLSTVSSLGHGNRGRRSYQRQLIKRTNTRTIRQNKGRRHKNNNNGNNDANDDNNNDNNNNDNFGVLSPRSFQTKFIQKYRDSPVASVHTLVRPSSASRAGRRSTNNSTNSFATTALSSANKNHTRRRRPRPQSAQGRRKKRGPEALTLPSDVAYSVPIVPFAYRQQFGLSGNSPVNSYGKQPIKIRERGERGEEDDRRLGNGTEPPQKHKEDHHRVATTNIKYGDVAEMTELINIRTMQSSNKKKRNHNTGVVPDLMPHGSGTVPVGRLHRGSPNEKWKQRATTSMESWSPRSLGKHTGVSPGGRHRKEHQEGKEDNPINGAARIHRVGTEQPQTSDDILNEWNEWNIEASRASGGSGGSGNEEKQQQQQQQKDADPLLRYISKAPREEYKDSLIKKAQEEQERQTHIRRTRQINGGSSSNKRRPQSAKVRKSIKMYPSVYSNEMEQGNKNSTANHPSNHPSPSSDTRRKLGRTDDHPDHMGAANHHRTTRSSSIHMQNRFFNMHHNNHTNHNNNRGGGGGRQSTPETLLMNGDNMLSHSFSSSNLAKQASSSSPTSSTSSPSKSGKAKNKTSFSRYKHSFVSFDQFGGGMDGVGLTGKQMRRPSSLLVHHNGGHPSNNNTTVQVHVPVLTTNDGDGGGGFDGEGRSWSPTNLNMPASPKQRDAGEFGGWGGDAGDNGGGGMNHYDGDMYSGFEKVEGTHRVRTRGGAGGRPKSAGIRKKRKKKKRTRPKSAGVRR